jgi:hypothetical protein
VHPRYAPPVGLTSRAVRRAWVVAGLIGLTVGAALGGFVGWEIRKWNWAWGSAGEWVSGLGALAAVLATVWLWRHDRAREERDALRRRKYALSAWLEQRDLDEPDIWPGWGYVAFVMNVSSEPVAAWDLEISALHWQDETHTRHEIRWHGVMSSVMQGALPPGRYVESMVDVPGSDGFGLPAVTFTDSLGYRWRREGDDVRPATEAEVMRAESARRALLSADGE